MSIIDSIRLSGTTYQIQGSGGGKAIEAGRGITITTGETADTISFSLPISAGTGTDSIVEGDGTKARGINSHAEGNYTTAAGKYSHAEGSDTIASGESSHSEGDSTIANGDYSHTEGYYTIANNETEHASGQYNNSVSASTTFGDSGNTLFSVGNGTSTSARHNAFEIRQNGDIYLSSGGTDIKLQDHLGGSSITVDTALDSGSTNPVANSAITTALDDKQDTLVSSQNIKTINNESILGSGNIDIQGGGKAIEAGRGITITTGETADTVSFNLPISAGTGTNSIREGINTTASGYSSHAEGTATQANGDSSHAEGSNTKANGEYSHTEGFRTIANNRVEHASGQYNVSNSATTATTFGDSGNTLFSVGNGMTNSTRHNAFEIRQNGDIYLTLDGQDVKLQDQLGGGGGGMTEDDELLLSTALTDLNDRKIDASEVKSNYQKKGDYATKDYVATALEPYETKTNVEQVVEQVEEVTSYALNDLNERFGGLKIVKISETEYAALTTKNENTLYIVVADPS